jgi:hypothetical protein
MRLHSNTAQENINEDCKDFLAIPSTSVFHDAVNDESATGTPIQSVNTVL